MRKSLILLPNTLNFWWYHITKQTLYSGLWISEKREYRWPIPTILNILNWWNTTNFLKNIKLSSGKNFGKQIKRKRVDKLMRKKNKKIQVWIIRWCNLLPSLRIETQKLRNTNSRNSLRLTWTNWKITKMKKCRDLFTWLKLSFLLWQHLSSFQWLRWKWMYMHIVLASLLLNMQKMKLKVLPRTERIYHL